MIYLYLALNTALKKVFHIIIIIVSLTILSCGGSSSDKSQGIIAYNVSYPKMDKHNLMFDFMPKKMVLKFKNNNYTTSLSAGMGMFKTDFVVNQEENEFSQLVKLINKKYILTLKGEEIEKSINHLPTFHIEYTGETKKILNYVCEKAIITVDNEANDAFTVFYTDQIELETPNWSNQFNGINGVMLEYQYEKYGICMRFKAKNIKFTEIDDSEFDLDAKYEHISEVRMDTEMQEIFDSFK
jgi:GLPGLI family protein